MDEMNTTDKTFAKESQSHVKIANLDIKKNIK